MSYIESALGNGEQVEYQAKISLWSQSGWIIAGLCTTHIMGIGLVFFAIAAINYFTTELAITNKKIIAKTGLIQRKTIELLLHKAESVQVDQGIFGRMLNFGTIVVSGAGNPQAPIPNISNPLQFRRKFLDLQEAAENAKKGPAA